MEHALGLDVLVAGFLTAQYVVNIENIVAILIIVTIVFHAFTGLGEDTPRVPGRFIVEARVAYSISGGEMCC